MNLRHCSCHSDGIEEIDDAVGLSMSGASTNHVVVIVKQKA